MEIFTFTSKNENPYDGTYNFVAEQELDAIEMATKFETEHNKQANDNNLILFFNIGNPTLVEIKEGFIGVGILLPINEES